jgi:hypothetical protein
MSNFERYTLLSHKMQAGVKHDQLTDPRFPFLAVSSQDVRDMFKHERVGINGARVEIGTLTKLLIDKGVFTEAEYFTEACAMMELEIEKYERILSDRLGYAVTLDTPFMDPVTGKPRV